MTAKYVLDERTRGKKKKAEEQLSEVEIGHLSKKEFRSR